MGGQVITVLGPVAPAEMGVTDAHNHLWISPVKDPALGLPVLDQFEQIERELNEYRQAGGGGQLDCQPGGAGRDGQKLRQLSQASRVHIVACTGFHLRQYYEEQAEVWSMNQEQAVDYFLSEIRNGLAETRGLEQPVRPGFIKIAVSASLGASPLNLVRASAEASLQTGLAIEMHTEKGKAAEEFVELFLELGLPLSRLVICHIDKRPDLGLHRELAEAGCMLEYDTFFRPKYAPESHVWQLLPAMVEAGLGASIALATDLADKALWKTMGGGPGLAGFVTEVKRRLTELIADQACLEGLMGANIAQRLALPIEG
jgi:phosphotriesterase-related protein